MGIKGLSTFLKQLEGNVSQEPLPRGATLVIDGSGWIFYLLEKSCLRQPFEPTGNYDALSDTIQQEVQYLRGQLELQLVVVFDGGDIRMKSQTAAKRKLEREEKVMNLYQLCAKGASYKWDDLPRPTLCSVQVKSTLTMLGVEIVAISGEGDQQISCMCRDNIHRGMPSYCYATDRYLNTCISSLCSLYDDVSSVTSWR